MLIYEKTSVEMSATATRFVESNDLIWCESLPGDSLDPPPPPVFSLIHLIRKMRSKTLIWTTQAGLAGASAQPVLSFLCWCCLYGASLYSLVRLGNEVYSTINIKISSHLASLPPLLTNATPHFFYLWWLIFLPGLSYNWIIVRS